MLMLLCGAGVTSEGKEVYLRDIWPSREEVREMEEDTIISSIFKDLRQRIEVRAPSFWPCASNTQLVPTTISCGVCPERERVLEQRRVSRLGGFPLGSQVHVYTLAVVFQQVGESLLLGFGCMRCDVSH